jgi:2'-hydroxyisoflavone reductase
VPRSADGEDASVHDIDVSAVYAAGLACRPVAQTVADTWRWLQDENWQPRPVPGRPQHGLSPDVERKVLASLAG